MRMLLRDLSPGTQYHLQLRTTSDSASSEWSRKFTILTATDTLEPAAPTGLTIVFSGPEAFLSWNPVTTNADGSAITDLASYQVTVRSPDGAGAFVKNVGLSTNMQFSLDTNRKTFGNPKGRLQFDIVALDQIGNPSTVATSGIATSTPLPNVTGLTSEALTSAVSLKWSPVTHNALAGYKVYQGTSVGLF